jgi:hypothetical protein
MVDDAVGGVAMYTDHVLRACATDTGQCGPGLSEPGNAEAPLADAPPALGPVALPVAKQWSRGRCHRFRRNESARVEDRLAEPLLHAGRRVFPFDPWSRRRGCVIGAATGRHTGVGAESALIATCERGRPDRGAGSRLAMLAFSGDWRMIRV